jgi:hypothetical protein
MPKEIMASYKLCLTYFSICENISYRNLSLDTSQCDIRRFVIHIYTHIHTRMSRAQKYKTYPIPVFV